MHYITNITKVEPFKIFCIFDGIENRMIDFSPILQDEVDTFYSKLKDEQIFKQVKLDPISKTIYWENLASMKDYDGSIKACELDFDPTVLYQQSISI